MHSLRGIRGTFPFFFVMVAVVAGRPAGAQVAPTEQKPVGAVMISPGQEPPYFVSPDFGHALVTIVQGTRTFVEFDGQPGPDLSAQIHAFGSSARESDDSYTIPAFSPDGSHVAYPVKGTDGSDRLYIDTQPAPLTGRLTFLRWSPQGDRLVYTVADDYGHLTIFDGSTSTAYTTVRSIRFSKDGKHLAYIAQPPEKVEREVVVDGKPGGLYRGVGEPLVSDDGSRVIYVAMDDTSQHMLVDNGVAGPMYLRMGLPAMSANGQRVAYVAQAGANQWVVVDNGKPGNPYKGTLSGVALSDDGQSLAYEVKVEAGVVVVVNGTEYGPFESAGASVAFGPGGKWAIPVTTLDQKREILTEGAPVPFMSSMGVSTVAFAKNKLVLIGTSTDTGAAAQVVISPGESNANLISAVVSPDGEHVAKVLNKTADDGSPGFAVALDDQPPGRVYIAVSDLCISADGQHVAYVARVLDSSGHVRLRVVHDGLEQPAHARILSLRLSPDGKHVAYVSEVPGAQDSSEVVEIDGATSPEYTMIVPPLLSPSDQLLKFGEDGTLRFAAVSNGQLNLCAYSPDALAKMPAAPAQVAVATPAPAAVVNAPPPPSPAAAPQPAPPAPAPVTPPPASPPPPAVAPAENADANPPATPGVGNVSRITTKRYTYLFVSQQTTGATLGASIAGMSGQLVTALQAGKFTLAGPFIWTFHNASADPTVPYTLDVGAMVPSGTTPPEGMTVETMHSDPVLSVTVMGGSNQMPIALGKLGAELAAKNLQKKDTMRFILTHFEAPESPKNVTEIQVDLAN